MISLDYCTHGNYPYSSYDSFQKSETVILAGYIIFAGHLVENGVRMCHRFSNTLFHAFPTPLSQSWGISEFRFTAALPGVWAREKRKKIFPDNSEKFSALIKISEPDFRMLHHSGTGCPARTKKEYHLKDS